MLTYKLKIKNKLEIQNWCKNYSFLYRKLYAHFELSRDKSFQKECQEKYLMDSWFYESCKLEVETKLAQEKTQSEKRTARIESIEKELQTSPKSKRKTYKLHESLAQLKKRQGKKITFGGLNRLRQISYLSNHPIENQVKLQQLKQKYQENRVLPICSIGETPQKSNRKFEFDLENQKIIFKLNKNTKFCAEFYCSRKQQLVLNRLQERVGTLAITVKINSDYVWLTFDEEKLAGYEFKRNDYKKAIQNITDKTRKKEIYKEFAEEQRQRKLENKNAHRYLAVDLNPEYVGISVVEQKNNDDWKIIHKNCVDLSNLNTQMGLSSTDVKQIAQNNKRRFEICEVWKYIFNLVQHYKVASLVCEELEFKPQNVNEKSTNANRKTKNLWHRTLSQNLIQKYCNVLGVAKVEVIPAYSSFIGNIQHPYFDPVNASLEIARRGVVKYCKGSSIFPELRSQDLDTMYQLGLDVPRDSVQSWKTAHEHFATSKLRYRRALDKNNVEDNCLYSHKSCTFLYNFV